MDAYCCRSTSASLYLNSKTQRSQPMIVDASVGRADDLNFYEALPLRPWSHPGRRSFESLVNRCDLYLQSGRYSEIVSCGSLTVYFCSSRPLILAVSHLVSCTGSGCRTAKRQRPLPWQFHLITDSRPIKLRTETHYDFPVYICSSQVYKRSRELRLSFNCPFTISLPNIYHF